MPMFRFIFLISLLLSTTARAQFQFDYNPALTVKTGSDTLENAWSGGLNYTQFSDFDFDFDGDMDLFLFDRSSNNIRVFTQEGSGSNTHYELAYNAKNYFPADIRYRATLVDFDADGRKDMFSYGIGGIKVHRNVGDATNGLQWELFTDLLYSEYANGSGNLYVSSSDIPAIVDVDFDGDTDILTFHIGGQHLEYHQNQSMELYGIPDSLIFELKNECWGKFQEDVTTNSVLLNDPNAPCVGGDISNPQKAANHSGSTVLALDIDNSGVLDLILGDVAFPNLTLLINGGTAPNTDSPMISADVAFPSNSTPAYMQLFPASYFLDVDFDGVKDLIVGANAKNVSQNVKSILFYKNYGTTAIPNFILTSDHFLQSEMVEHGLGSIPVLVDLNEDGLKDLIVANLFRYKPTLNKECTMAYYQNTGTSTNPVFSFVDDNYLNIPAYGYGLRSVPTFGDLDNDGDEDLFLGRENGTIAYIPNQSSGSGAVFTTPAQNYLDAGGQLITAAAYAHPQLFDLNEDGLLDLILGGKSGKLIYYRNSGTVTSPQFTLHNANLGNVNVSTVDNPDGYSAPHFFRYADTTYLFAGDFSGRMNYFSQIEGQLDPGQSFVLETPDFLGINTDAYSSFWVEDVNNNGNLELYVGQDLGGLWRFEHDPNSGAAIFELPQSKFTIYPNPTKGTVIISSLDETIGKIWITSVFGELIFESADFQQKWELDLSNYPSGVYFVTVQSENRLQSTKKLVKL